MSTISLLYLSIIILGYNSLFTCLSGQQPQLPFSIMINCAQPPITLNNIMDSQPQTTVAPVQIAKQSTTQELRQKIDIKDIQKKLNALNKGFLLYCWEKKYQIFFGIIFCSILSFCYYYHCMKQFFKDEKNWANWHNGSLENLLESVTQSESITDILLKEIQIRYYSWESPTDPIQALIRFSIAIDQEINTLKRYLFILGNAKIAYLHYILPIEKDQQDAEKRLGFVLFLKKQFLEWISRHNAKTLYTTNSH